METINKTLIQAEQRINFLPKHCGADFMSFENAVYDFMGHYCKDYDGGLWEFFELSNGGFYMAYDTDKSALLLENADNYYSGSMTPEAASIAICLLAQNALAWKTEAARWSDKFYALRDYAISHPEAAQIMGFID